jgi:hypothetical protein
LLSVGCGVGFACDNPPLVVIPEGASLQGQEQAVQDAAAQYFTAMQAYTDCIKGELEAAGGDDAPSFVKALLVRRNNLAVAEAEAVMKLYNDNADLAPAQGADGGESTTRDRED